MRKNRIVATKFASEKIKSRTFQGKVRSELSPELLHIEESKAFDYLENSPVCTKILDLDFNLQYMSSAGIEGLKIDKVEDYYGKPFPFHFYPKTAITSINKNLELARKTGQIVQGEDLITDINGNELWFHATITPVKNDIGQLEYYTVVSVSTTEQKQAQKKLVQSESRIRGYMEDSPICAKILDLDFNLQYMSRAGVEGLNIKNIEDYYGKPYPFAFYSDSFKAQMKEDLQEAKSSGETVRREAAVVDVFGNEMWYDTTIVPVKDKENKLDHMMVVSLDTTDRKKAEEKLTLTESRTRDYLESSPVCTKILDLDFNLQYMSRAGIEALRISNIQDYYGKPFPFSFYPEKAKEEINRNLIRARETGEIIQSEDLIFDVNGNTLWFQATITPIKDAKGQLEYFNVVSVGITDQKQAENRLLENNRKMDAILDTAMDGFMRQDMKGNLLEVNASFCKVTGFTKSELIGMNATELEALKTPEEVERVIEAVLENGVVKFETKLWKKDGSKFDVDLNITYHPHGEGELVVFVRDITKRKKAEEKLKVKNQVFDVSVAANSTSDKEGVITQANKAFIELWGYASIEEVIGMPIREIFQSKEELREITNTLDTAEKWKGEYTARKQDGSTFIAQTIATKLIDENGNMIGYQSSVVDITNEKQIEQQLHNTLQNLEALVEIRTEELKETSKKLEAVHNDFMSSLQYAKRIQKASVPSKAELKRAFRDTWVIFKPRDVVSGDFYWLYQNQDEAMIALVDCTGHGVPGAMLSMAGFGLLDSIAINREIRKPDLVLKEMDNAVTTLLGKKGSGASMQDGMEMSVVHIDFRTSMFTFSGARSNGIFVNKNGVTMLESDRYGIGGLTSKNDKQFSRQQIEFESGDRFFLFTDGVYDQFGGPKNKKMLRKNLEHQLIESCHMNMTDQGMFIEKTFDNWKGNAPQIDDVSLIGIQL